MIRSRAIMYLSTTKTISIRLFGLISSLRKTRTAFYCGLSLVTLTILLITIRSRIPRLTTPAYVTKTISKSISKSTYSILEVIQNPDRGSRAYVFYHGTVSVKDRWTEGQPNNGTLTNMTANNLSAAYDTSLMDLTATCSPFLGFKYLHISMYQLRATTNRQPYLCTVGRFEPRHPCYCFSFSHTEDLHFETEMISNTACQVFMFLPTMKQDSHIRNERLLIFKQGLSDSFIPGSNVQVSKDSILGYLNRFNARHITIDVMKIELGMRQWSVLKRASLDGSLENVKQLILTIRSGEIESDEEYMSRISTLRNLFDIGFRVYYSNREMKRHYTLTTIAYLNAKCVLLKGTCVLKNSLTKIAVPLQTLKLSKAPQYNRIMEAKKANLSALSASELENLYFNIVQQQHLFCPLSRRIGDVNDGGWDVCFTDPFDIKKSKPCVAFSFGINHVWGYDDELADKYNCRVYMFDPSMTKVNDHKRRKTSWFFRTGLSSKNNIESNGWKMRTLCRLFDELGHSTDTIDILKIDIEYWEWSVFETALNEGCLKRVKQLMFESHTSGLFHKESDYAQFIRIFMRIFDAGFRTWKWHMNPESVFYRSIRKTIKPCCYEHYLLNSVFTEIKT